jgi:DNA-binding LytR/AlgR family response regulator
MKCVVVDDESSARGITVGLCARAGVFTLAKEFSNGLDAIKYVVKHRVDVMFLDIHMPNFSGFDVIESLEYPPKIILTTSDSNFALDAFNYDCVLDYLVKPLNFKRFQLSVDKLQKHNQSRLGSINTAALQYNEIENNLFVNVGRRLVKIGVDTIYLIGSNGDYVNVICEQSNYKVHSTLNNIVSKLPSSLFIRVHRSYVVNINKIIDIEDNSLLVNKTVVPIGRTHRNELMDRLNLL